jgi:hypothetical protein
MRSMRNHRGLPGGIAQIEVKRLLPAVLLLFSMWLLSGCVVTPIEAQDGSMPVGT